MTAPTPTDIQAAKPAMLCRRTYGHVLAIGIAETMEGVTVDFSAKPSRWPLVWLVVIVGVIAWQFRGIIH